MSESSDTNELPDFPLGENCGDPADHAAHWWGPKSTLFCYGRGPEADR